MYVRSTGVFFKVYYYSGYTHEKKKKNVFLSFIVIVLHFFFFCFRWTQETLYECLFFCLFVPDSFPYLIHPIVMNSLRVFTRTLEVILVYRKKKKKKILDKNQTSRDQYRRSAIQKFH